MGNSWRNVLLLGLVSFINDVSSEMILPLLPFFISQLGGGGIALGIISGVGESVASLLKVLSGYSSDKLGKRKPFVYCGYLMASMGKLLLAFAKSWPVVLILRVLDRSGKGVRDAPRDALIASSTVRSARGRGFGLHKAMDSLGAVVGAILAFLLFYTLGFQIGRIFIIAGILGFASLIPIHFVREKTFIPALGLRLDFHTLPRRLKIFLGIAWVFAAGNFSYMFFMLRAQQFFDPTIAVAISLGLYIVYNIFYTLFSVPAGALSDRLGRARVLALGYLLFALVCLGFFWASTFNAFLMLFALFGINYAFVEANERALVADLTHESKRGTALGAYHTVKGLGALPAGLVAGLLWGIKPELCFAFGAGMALLAVILLCLLKNALTAYLELSHSR